MKKYLFLYLVLSLISTTWSADRPTRSSASSSSSSSSTGHPGFMTELEELQRRQAPIFQGAYQDLSQALNTIHSHIAALRRRRTGNPQIDNMDQLRTDYQTLSDLIRSISTYQYPAGNPLHALQTFQPTITHYRNETPLTRSLNRFIVPSIKRAIRELRRINHNHDVFPHISQTIALIRRDIHGNPPSLAFRNQVAEHRQLSLDRLNEIIAPVALPAPQHTSSSSSSSSKPKANGPMDRFLVVQTKEQIAEMLAKAFKKRQKVPQSCRGPIDKFIKQDNDDDDEENQHPNKRQRRLPRTQAAPVYINN